MKFKLKDCLKQTNESDVIANKYVFRCLTCEQIVVLIVMLLVATGIFVTNFGVTVRCVIITTIIYMLAIPVRLYADMSKRWVKYYLILLEILWVTCVGVFMTFHALLSYALPLLSATMFRSKKISIYTYVLLVFKRNWPEP